MPPWQLLTLLLLAIVLPGTCYPAFVKPAERAFGRREEEQLMLADDKYVQEIAALRQQNLELQRMLVAANTAAAKAIEASPKPSNTNTHKNIMAQLYSHQFDTNGKRGGGRSKIDQEAAQALPFVGDFWPYHDHQRVEILGEDPSIVNGDYSSCEHLDVIHRPPRTEALGKKRCAMVVESGTWASEGWLFGYKIDKQTHKAVGSLGMTPQVPDRNYPKWIDQYFSNYDRVILPFLNARAAMVREIRGLLSLGGKPEPVLVMGVNSGHVSLVLNFLCSLRKNKIALMKHVVYVSSAADRQKLQSLGVTAYYNQAISGALPNTSARGYGDGDFMKTVMIKQFATYLTLEAGAHVLFQDADLIWDRNPLPNLVEGSKRFDQQYMDDNSRQPRFAPFFANTGFYYVKHCDATRHFWHHALVSSGFVMDWQGNQAFVNWMLEIHHKRFGHTVKTLNRWVYMSGATLRDYDEPGMKEDVLVRHFCWTVNKKDKHKWLSKFGQLYISDACWGTLGGCFDTTGKASMNSICTRGDGRAGKKL